MIFNVVKRMLQLAAGTAIIVAATAGPALAHVELASSTPGDSETATAAPEAIVLEFSVEAVIAGDGFILAASDGTALEATVTQTNSTTVVVSPSEPLLNGTYGVAWTMKAGDAHPATGNITFGISDPLNAAAQNESSGTAADSQSPGGGGTDAGPLQSVFTDQANSPNFGDWVTRIGRWAAMSAGLIAIGAFAFAATSLVGTRREVAQVGFWVRRAGIVIVAGTALEAIGVSLAAASMLNIGFVAALVDTFNGSFGVALLLRFVAGLALLHGTTIVTTQDPNPIALRLSKPVPAYAGAGFAEAPRLGSVHAPARPTWRLDVHREGYAIAGLAIFVVSFLFDGHTVTAAPAAVVLIADVVHVAAAGVWVGGVAFMANVLASRKRRNSPLDGAAMAIRFSTVATAALAAVGIAGGLLTFAILDNIGELFTTDWGRLLMIKMLAVGAAASIGAYNHFRVVPTLERNADNAAALSRLRTLVRAEAWILVCVIAVTAALVGAAS